jgi:hypothetical protein
MEKNTPTEAAAALAGLLTQYKAALAARHAAEEALDQEAIDAANAGLGQIRDKVREMMKNISPEELSDRRCYTLVLAASRGATPRGLRDIAEALVVSCEDGITVPAHRYESMFRGRGWARLEKGDGDGEVWAERVAGGYRLRKEGRWIIGGSNGLTHEGETTWDVRRVAGMWIAS